MRTVFNMYDLGTCHAFEVFDVYSHGTHARVDRPTVSCRMTIKNESIKIKLIKLNSDINYAIHFRNNSECDE